MFKIFSNITRVVIVRNGREFDVKADEPVQFSIQDDNRTLKIFYPNEKG